MYGRVHVSTVIADVTFGNACYRRTEHRLRGAARTTCFGEGRRTVIKRAKDNQFRGKKKKRKKDRDVAFNLSYSSSLCFALNVAPIFFKLSRRLIPGIPIKYKLRCD